MLKKRLLYFLILLSLPQLLGSCVGVGEKTGNMSVIYMVTTAASFLILICYLFFMKNKNAWITVLFVAAATVNTGYLALALSKTLETALWANRISYLGSVFLPMAMLLIVLQVTGLSYKKQLPALLIGIGIIVFLIAASPGILDWYYREVSLQNVNGASVLVKVYGPLHPLYLVYILAYFGCMVATLVQVFVKKKIDSPLYSVLLISAVFVNVVVWFLEQLVHVDFELLSVSYIFSELFILGVYLLLHAENKSTVEPLSETVEPKTAASAEGEYSTEAFEIFKNGVDKLTHTESLIYDCYLEGKSTKEIMAELNIKENTLKYHNKNIYGKLGVSSRKQLIGMANSLKQ